MDYLILAGCGLTRLDAAKVLPLVLLVCQRGCKWSTNPLQYLVHIIGLFQGQVINRPEQDMLETEYAGGGEVEHKVCTTLHWDSLISLIIILCRSSWFKVMWWPGLAWKPWLWPGFRELRLDKSQARALSQSHTQLRLRPQLALKEMTRIA